MLAQEIPGPQHAHEDDHGLINFGPDLNQGEYDETELDDGDDDAKKEGIDSLENDIKIVIVQ